MSEKAQSQSATTKKPKKSKPSYSVMLLDAIMTFDNKKATTEQIETIIKNKYDNFSNGFNKYLQNAIIREIKNENITKHKYASKIFYKVTNTYKTQVANAKTNKVRAPAKQGIPPIDKPHGGALSRHKCCAIPSHKISPDTMDEAVEWLKQMIQYRITGSIEKITIEKLKYFLLNAPEQQGDIANIGGRTLRFPFYRFGVPEWLYHQGLEHYRRLQSHQIAGIFHEILNELLPGDEDSSLQYKNDTQSWKEYASWNDRNKALCEPRDRILVANTVTKTGKKKKFVVNMADTKVVLKKTKRRRVPNRQRFARHVNK